MLDSNRIFYCIHTEYKNSNLASLVSKFFDCYAIFEGTGFWKGIPEHAARIEIIGTEDDRNKVIALADWICTVNGQEAVYVTSYPVLLDDIRIERKKIAA